MIKKISNPSWKTKTLKQSQSVPSRLVDKDWPICYRPNKKDGMILWRLKKLWWDIWKFGWLLLGKLIDVESANGLISLLKAS